MPAGTSFASSQPPDCGPVELSAQSLHELAVQAFRVGNRGRLSLCEALRALHETRLYLDLGFPGLAGYADAFFQLRRSETFEYVRVARRLLELTRLREAFAEGRIGWSVLKVITRVASVDSQATWIAFAGEHGVERTLAEARDALRRGRDAPRDSSFGLPNLDQKLVLRFARSDMEKVRRWIEGACALVVESTGAEEVSLEQAVLFLCEQDAASGASSSPRAQIAYQRCPDCRKARVATRDGFVEVSAEEVERYEGCADPIVIDGPTPPKVRRQILAREGGRCGNPRCHHPADHCHHIVFRSQGGKTELVNEVAVCGTCHALVHAGLLRVVGQAPNELCWMPVGAGDSLRLNSPNSNPPPVLRFVGTSTREESANADSVAPTDHGLCVRDLTSGLVRLGIPTARSKELIHAAIEAILPAEVTEANVLQRALASL
jgi:5-methylcytosine-specific restriction endonuclease McrA